MSIHFFGLDAISCPFLFFLPFQLCTLANSQLVSHALSSYVHYEEYQKKDPKEAIGVYTRISIGFTMVE